MAELLSPSQIRTVLLAPATIKPRAYELLWNLARLVNRRDNERDEYSEVVELILRTLEHREHIGAYTPLLDALVRQVGLFPYLRLM